MKKFLAFVLFLLAIPFAIAEDNATSGYACPSTSDLEAAMAKCKSAGLDYSTYVDERGCKQVRCLEHEKTCLTKAQLDESRQHCREKGLYYYSKYDTSDCEYIVCGSPSCQSESELNSQILRCTEYGKRYETFKDEQGCQYAKCVEKSCPDVSAEAAKCNAQGMRAEYIAGTDGCKTVKCSGEYYQCRKYMDGDCTIVTCKDGFYYNTCKSACDTSMKTPPAIPEKGEPVSEPAEELTEEEIAEAEGLFARIFGFLRG